MNLIIQDLTPCAMCRMLKLQTLFAIVTSISAIVSVSEVAAEQPKGEFDKLVQKSAEVAAATRQAAEKAKPVLVDPARKQDERRAWREVLLAADKEIEHLISEGLKIGLKPSEIGHRTESLTFRELHRDLSARGRGIGLSDSQLTKEEWLDPKNSVVVTYREGRTKNGNAIYLFRDSYRSPMQEYMRQIVSQYTAVVSPNSVRIDELPIRYAPELWMPSGIPGAVETFLGFVDTGEDLPHLAFLDGPAGRGRFANFFAYTFDKAQGKWIRRQLNNDQIDSFSEPEYRDESSTLVYTAHDYSVPEPPPAPGTTWGPMVAIPKRTFEFDFKKVLKEIGQKPYPGAP